MSEEIRLGLAGEKRLAVTREMTIALLAEDLPAVLSTPSMIMLMELTATEVIRPHLPPGHISVGVEVNIRHHAATPEGAAVHAQAKVIEVARNLVKFEVEAYDDRQLIGSGTHTRAIIELERFRRGLEKDQ
jgi:predicted thioesterase